MFTIKIDPRFLMVIMKVDKYIKRHNLKKIIVLKHSARQTPQLCVTNYKINIFYIYMTKLQYNDKLIYLVSTSAHGHNVSLIQIVTHGIIIPIGFLTIRLFQLR